MWMVMTINKDFIVLVKKNEQQIKGEGLVCLCTSSDCTFSPNIWKALILKNVYAWRKEKPRNDGRLRDKKKILILVKRNKEMEPN